MVVGCRPCCPAGIAAGAAPVPALLDGGPCHHDGLGYLADRYDLQITLAFIPDARHRKAPARSSSHGS